MECHAKHNTKTLPQNVVSENKHPTKSMIDFSEPNLKITPSNWTIQRLSECHTNRCFEKFKSNSFEKQKPISFFPFTNWKLFKTFTIDWFNMCFIYKRLFTKHNAIRDSIRCSHIPMLQTKNQFTWESVISFWSKWKYCISFCSETEFEPTGTTTKKIKATHNSISRKPKNREEKKLSKPTLFRLFWLIRNSDDKHLDAWLELFAVFSCEFRR